MDPVNVSAKFAVRSFILSCDNIDCSFGFGLRTPNLRERDAVGGRGWYRSKERWSSYKPSILTFHPSLRVSEILPLLCYATFPHPTSSLPKISPCSPGSRWMAFGLRRAKMWANRTCN